ncbi:MAG: 6-phosphogluconolactonase, partial [Gammaproteobacteria bacterium]|nr:6-phosphogluconolactonase [Gammaproteobacteria bacterium]
MSEIKTNQKSNAKWVVLPSASDVADSALDIILTAAKAAIQDHGEFRIVLAGGSTPEQVYAILAGQSED